MRFPTRRGSSPDIGDGLLEILDRSIQFRDQSAPALQGIPFEELKTGFQNLDLLTRLAQVGMTKSLIQGTHLLEISLKMRAR